jgi:NADH-quinone oxidoreductase subunit N
MVQQFNIKRFFAFRAISNSGILLIGFVSNRIESVEAVILYLVIYITMNVTAFAILKVIQSGNVDKPLGFDEFKGLGKTNSVLAFTIAILFFSLAGTPPLAGFIRKAYLFYVVIINEYYGLAT